MRRRRQHRWLRPDADAIAAYHVEREAWLKNQKRLMEALMATIDRLDKPVRELVYEYGHTGVMREISQGVGAQLRVLRPALKAWRQKRQAELLATNHQITFRNRRRSV